jgi:hypothetical protein
MAQDSSEPEQPRLEPEIIPPEPSYHQAGWRRAPWDTAWGPHAARQAGARHHVYVTRLGPFGVAFLFLVLAALVVVGFLAVLGALLIWLPIVAFLVLVAGTFRFLRR